MTDELVLWLENLGAEDIGRVGGKNSSLGRMMQELGEAGIRVPPGFATTATAYRSFLEHNQLEDRIAEQIDQLHDGAKAEDVGPPIREAIRGGEFPEDLTEAIRGAYSKLCERIGKDDAPVAARSSATAEDLPEASFAGQLESFLNVRGPDRVLDACKRCFASLFTDRAIAYREHHDFDHLDIALSVGVQKMVRADTAGAGVMFSIDTDTGFPRAVLIDAGFGLGESVVSGSITPDEYRVFKPLLDEDGVEPIIEKTRGAQEQMIVYAEPDAEESTETVETSDEERRRFVLDDAEILQLARWGVRIEEVYERPMDMEWAKDGDDGELYIVQARPETVQAQKASGKLKTWSLTEAGEEMVSGTAIGDAIAAGRARVVSSPDAADDFEKGDVLVTERTDPDWVPLMRRAAAIVTDHGGRTSHAAIVSRELGVPAVLGCGDATAKLDGEAVTVDCTSGESGRVLRGELEFDVEEVDIDDLPEAPVPLLINVATPAGAMRWWQLPVEGVGLARLEFVINQQVQVHPLALTRYDELEDDEVRRKIDALTAGYDDRREFFVERLGRAVAGIAAAWHPKRVIVRLSDFKTNEYAELLGGRRFEGGEPNPMLGFRGAARYDSDRYRDGFELECRAIRMARERLGLTNVAVMVPFVRTPEEAEGVLKRMAEHGLGRGERGLELYMMCEVPSNVFLARDFARHFDGFSIGSNDLTQLVLGVDRDSEALRELFDEGHPAVRRAIEMVLEGAHAEGVKVGICGQGPSDDPDFAAFLVDAGIDTISLNPDSVVGVMRRLGQSRQGAS